jgi:orotidine-5'-phosphate decarboxylase
MHPELAVAFDFPDKAAALRCANILSGKNYWAKIGMELHTAEGPDIVRAFKDLGFKVFLDLKFHDIPNTVRSAARSAAKLGVDMLTIHASGGLKMVQAAREAAADMENPPKILAVTLLTSMEDKDGLLEQWPSSELAARRLAGIAKEGGADGLVCSGHELKDLKALTGLACLVPGVRRASGEPGDQARVVTPAQAARDGADWIVVGRPITRARSPASAAEEIVREMLASRETSSRAGI